MTLVKRLVAIVLLEIYALVLTTWQMGIGIRTDEAKYLLNIPYPHPPLARFILNLTEAVPFQELLWRIIFASLIVQATWFIRGMAKNFPGTVQIALSIAWLGCMAILQQGGTIMMAPLTALQALVFVWLLLKKTDLTPFAWLIGLFWLCSLFTAYQAILFFPIVLAVFWRMHLPVAVKVSLFLIPIALLVLYTMTNLLVLAGIVMHAGKAASFTLMERLAATANIWLLSGGIIVSILGIVGCFLSPHRFPLLLTLLFIFAYVFLGQHGYYAILFLPIPFAGMIPLLQKYPNAMHSLLWITPFITISFLIVYPSPNVPSRAHKTMQILADRLPPGDVFVKGSFGHEWQYRSTRPVRTYQEQNLAEAAAVICLRPCEELKRQPLFTRLTGTDVPVWISLQH